DGGLSVAADVRIDDTPVPAASVRPIGSTGIYRWEVIGAAIEVTFAPAPLTPPVRAAILAAETIEVDGEDRELFLTEAYPVIARQAPLPVASGLELPAPARPQPVLRVTFGAADRMEHRFEWEYRGHGTVPVIEI